MYSVLLVEDELLVRMGLKNSIEWGKFGMRIAADAADGRTAYELYERERPDLIITDLKMPVMNGMELIEKVREKDRDVKIVILTCLEEFELARQAISLGVSDYILKLTMTVDQINAVLSRISSEMSQEKSLRNSRLVDDADIGSIKGKALFECMLEKSCNKEEASTLADRYGFRFRHPKVILGIMELDRSKCVKPMAQDRVGFPSERAVLEMMHGILENAGNAEVAFMGGAGFVIVAGYGSVAGKQEILQEFILLLKEIESTVRAFFNTSVSFALSAVGSNYAELRELFIEAKGFSEDKFFGGPGFYGPELAFDRSAARMNRSEQMLKLCERIALGAAGFQQVYAEKIRSIMESDRPKSEYQEQFCRLVQWIAGAVRFQGDGNEQSILSAIKTIQTSGTFDEIIRCFNDLFACIASEIRRRRITNREVLLAMDFIETNYGGELSLQQAAAAIGLSPSYLSSLFKKETGVSFIEYLNDIRLDKAKELLLDTYLRTYEIAESVGFNENTYFCRLFKKTTGMTPGEYRRQWQKRWAEEPEDEADGRQ